MRGDTIRAFVALPCPPGLKAELAQALEVWQALSGPVRWTDPEKVHLTVRFLGESPGARLERLGQDLGQAAATSPPIALSPSETGAFPGWGRPRVLWLGFEADPGLIELARAVESQAREAGFDPEERAFAPHLTIGRVKDARGARKAADAVRLWRPGTGAEIVDEIVLYRSELGVGGPRYTPLARHSLAGR